MSCQKKKFSFSFFALALVVVLCGYLVFARPNCDNCSSSPTVTQFSSVKAFVAGCYDGVATMDCLKRAGNFGVGCVESLDGEIVVLDGEVYQIRFDGSVNKLQDDKKTPFATVVKFEESSTYKVENKTDLAELIKYLDTLLPDKNALIAVRITGNFNYVHTRSAMPQKKPYTSIAAITTRQPDFEAENQIGDVIAFRVPEYMSGVSVTGWHMHFLSKDKKFGGHLLNISLKDATISVCFPGEFKMVFPPKGHDFYKTDLSKYSADAFKTSGAVNKKAPKLK